MEEMKKPSILEGVYLIKAAQKTLCILYSVYSIARMQVLFHCLSFNVFHTDEILPW